MAEPAYEIARKRSQRDRLLEFLSENLLPDYLDYLQLGELIDFVDTAVRECGESPLSAFCDYYELGPWFARKMRGCDFDLEDFYCRYATEIEWRAAE